VESKRRRAGGEETRGRERAGVSKEREREGRSVGQKLKPGARRKRREGSEGTKGKKDERILHLAKEMTGRSREEQRQECNSREKKK